MSTSRVTALTASLVCRVVSTRCPVNEACKASSAVSASRTSPTRTTSGSCRSTDRRPAPKVRPALSLIWTWVIPPSWTSTGSSSVMMLRSGALISLMAAYRVFVLPDPVGPVINTSPCGVLSVVSRASS